MEGPSRSNATAIPAPASCMCLTMPSRASAGTGSSHGSESRSSHLDKHVHLTNCIHLRNRFHVQRHKMTVEARHHLSAGGVAAAGLPLMRELTALSRTRSLRDPSTSSILKSPLMKGSSPGARKLEQALRGKDKSTVATDQQQEHRNDSQTGSSNFEANRGGESYKSAAVSEDQDPLTKVTKRNRKVHQDRSSLGSHGSGSLSRKIVTQLQQQQQTLATNVQGQSPSPLSLGVYDDPSILLKFAAGPAAPRRKSKNNSFESDPEASAEDEVEEKQQVQKVNARSRSHSPLLSSRDISNKSRSPVVSREIANTRAFSFPDPGQQHYHYTGTNEDELECSQEPKHGCGIPWNWSRLGQKPKGKGFLDSTGKMLRPEVLARRKAGEHTLSRSQSESGRELATAMFQQDCLSYSSAGNSDAEALPLLTEPEASVSGDVAASSVEVDSDNVVAARGELNPRGILAPKGRSQVTTEALQARLRERLAWISERRVVEGGGSDFRQNKSLSYKYRPKTFRDMVGQNVVMQSLANAVLRGRIVSLYLFQGPRGTGKSSAARVFAAALNCLSSEELRPCGLCRECVALNLGKSLDVREFDASRFNGLGSVKELLEVAILPPSSGRYRLSVVDEVHTLTAESWNFFLKGMEELPGNSIVILITSNPEQLPRTLGSRCQKYPFTKLKDPDIISRLQKLATKENIDIEIEALELIASRSNGSLRDAEMTLDQLGLLGQVVTLSTLQELVGLLPDDKLMDLLDFALSGDTVSTVKSVRNLLESGVEPLALMSQLATLITDMLAGSYKPVLTQRKRRFFHKITLSKEDLERLRQALKILSEAEKQVRASSDQTTWLTAAILQFAPDRAYIFPASSSGSSATQSLVGNDTSEKETIESDSGALKQGWEPEHEHFENPVDDTAVFAKPEVPWANKSLSTVPEARIHPYVQTASTNDGHDTCAFDQKRLDDVWQKALKNSRSKSLKHLLRHGKLISLSMQEVQATVEIEFQHSKQKAKAEKSRSRISHAFQSSLGCPVEVQIKLASKLLEHDKKRVSLHPLRGDHLHRKPGFGVKRDGETSPSQHSQQRPQGIEEERLETAWARQSTPSITPSDPSYYSAGKEWSSAPPGRAPLGLVIQRQGPTLANLSERESHSQASQYDLKFQKVRHLGPEVLTPREAGFEHANLRLESRTKSNRRLLCCWRSSPRSDEEKRRRKEEKKAAKQRRRRRRRACFFMRIVPCAGSHGCKSLCAFTRQHAA
ncbi:hypothetical protein SELMODRAFT_423688 [Selaginella moellendorffii]|uniref:Uncharacterized protein n=2 Tax=Selaginella moellendorffii TaxID=88036 RepID=D8SMK2_SELML|nr:hypothetical protein SELMODRAFT_423688 [Selaginella moellendorffii]